MALDSDVTALGERTGSDEMAAWDFRSQLTDWPKSLKTLKQTSGKPLRKLLGKNCLFWGLPTAAVLHQPLIGQAVVVEGQG